MCHFVSNLHISDQSGRFHLFSPSPRWVTQGWTQTQPAPRPGQKSPFFFKKTKPTKPCSRNTSCQSRKSARKLHSGCSDEMQEITEAEKWAILASAFSSAPANLQPARAKLPNTPTGAAHLTTTHGLQLSDLGESLNVSLPGFTGL